MVRNSPLLIFTNIITLQEEQKIVTLHRRICTHMGKMTLLVYICTSLASITGHHCQESPLHMSVPLWMGQEQRISLYTNNSHLPMKLPLSPMEFTLYWSHQMRYRAGANLEETGPTPLLTNIFTRTQTDMSGKEVWLKRLSVFHHISQLSWVWHCQCWLWGVPEECKRSQQKVDMCIIG